MIIFDIGTELTKVVDTSDKKKEMVVFQTVDTGISELFSRASGQQKAIVAMSDPAMRVVTISFSTTFSADVIADFILEQGHVEVLRIVRDDFNDLGEEGVVAKINLVHPHVVIVSLPSKNKMPYSENFKGFEKTLKKLSSNLAQDHNLILLTDLRQSEELGETIDEKVVVLPQIWEKGTLVGDNENLASKLRELAKSSYRYELELNSIRKVNIIPEQTFLKKSLECFLAEHQEDVFSKENCLMIDIGVSKVATSLATRSSLDSIWVVDDKWSPSLNFGLHNFKFCPQNGIKKLKKAEGFLKHISDAGKIAIYESTEIGSNNSKNLAASLIVELLVAEILIMFSNVTAEKDENLTQVVLVGGGANLVDSASVERVASGILPGSSIYVLADYQHMKSLVFE